ncbi:MAG: VCBS repeat-containing protein [Myxococcota bacterium]
MSHFTLSFLPPRATGFAALALLFSATACLPSFEEDCFSDPSGPGCEEVLGNNETVEEVLDDLGVIRSSEPRVDENGDPLPADYAPLGSRRTINRFSEILFFGGRLEDELSSVGRMPIVDVDPGPNNSFSVSLLADPPPEETPWLADDRNIPRVAVEGDFDRDGQDEIAVVYQIPNEPVRLVIQEGGAAPGEAYTFGEPIVVDTNTWLSLAVESGDFDGNGTVDLAVALTAEDRVQLVFFSNQGGSFLPDGAPRIIERPEPSGAAVWVAMESGNLDDDIAQELAVIANFRTVPALRVYDDAQSGYAPAQGLPERPDFRLETETETAVVADLAVGDVDGDGVDELVVAGLDRSGTVRSELVHYLVGVFDDLKHGMDQLSGLRVLSGANTLQPTASGANQQLAFVHALTADVDGDGLKEIVINQFLFDNLARSGGELIPLDLGDGPIEIPIKDLFTDGNSGDDYDFNPRSSAMSAGDVTSDRREDVVLYAQRLDVNGERQELQIWSLDQIDGWTEVVDLESTFANPLNDGNSEIRPQLILTDAEVDNESMALEYSEGSYRFVFTEPVILAALASPPCSTELGQDLGSSCQTAFGRAVTETQERENSWSISAGVSVGFEADIPFVGSAEAILNTRSTVEQSTSSAYELQTSVVRQTGALEDSVIFTTVPLDIYTYEVLSHPNPDLIGEKIEVRLPREPITVLVETRVYNAAILEDGTPIDEAIFQHVVGDPSSYKSRSEKNSILSRNPGVETEEVDVGQGTGQTTVSISDFSSTTQGSAYDFEASLDVKATAGGVVGGYSVGGGVGSAVRVTRGQETIYEGAVGNIAAEFFPRDAYSWGLFAYIYEDRRTGQTFEVLDYWVEQP